MLWLKPRWRAEAYNPETGDALIPLSVDDAYCFYRHSSAVRRAAELNETARWLGARHRYRTVRIND